MKFAKVRITSHRPPIHKSQSTGMDHWNRIEKAMSAQHDAALRGYSTETLYAALSDLSHRKASEKGNPEHRWIRHRRAAIQRRLYAPELVRC